MEGNQRNIRLHFIGWIIFLSYEITAIGMASGSFTNLRYYILHYAINICLFYIHANLILPTALKNGKQGIWMVPVFIIAELGLYLTVGYYSDHIMNFLLGQTEKGDLDFTKRYIFSAIWRGIYFLGFGTAYYLFNRYLKERNEREILEKKLLENTITEKENVIQLQIAKNAHLKAQINPHFLFNTLNFIYSSIHKSSPVAGKALMYLTKIMRYALSSSQGPGLIELKTEIIQAENLIQLWEIKNSSENLKIDFEYAQEAKTVKFVPLVLLTLLENMFKHGNLSVADKPGRLSIKTEKGYLVIETYNLINTGLNDTGEHTGLNYINEKMKLIYGESATFYINAEDGEFHSFTKVPIF